MLVYVQKLMVTDMKLFLKVLPFLFIFNCFAKQNGVPNGLFYTNASTLIQKTEVNSDKKSKECVNSVLGYVAAGDMSVEKISSKAGIKNVTGVTHTSNGALGIFQEYCVIIQGN